jgi:hypothetical protein
MKLTLILCILFSFNCLAGKVFIPKDNIGVCDVVQFSGGNAKKVCEDQTGKDCIGLKKYNCNYHIGGKVMVDDLGRPKYSKSDIESCTLENCNDVLANKVCTDQTETAIKNLETMEVYCSKQIGYHQKEIDGIVIDPVKKTCLRQC